MPRIKIPETPRATLCVWSGKTLIHTAGFYPGTLSEGAVVKPARAALLGTPGARWTVSVRCYGALSDVPVVGESRPEDVVKRPRKSRAGAKKKERVCRTCQGDGRLATATENPCWDCEGKGTKNAP
jgi:hypothetical protein